MSDQRYIVKEVDEREERLPRWAQDKLASLRMDVRVLEDELRAVQRGVGDDVRWFVRAGLWDGWQPLAENVTIMYRSKSGDIELTFRGNEDHLRVCAEHGTLRITPWAANALQLRTES